MDISVKDEPGEIGKEIPISRSVVMVTDSTKISSPDNMSNYHQNNTSLNNSEENVEMRKKRPISSTKSDEPSHYCHTSCSNSKRANIEDECNFSQMKSLDEMNEEILRIKNQNLSEKLSVRHHLEDELNKDINSLRQQSTSYEKIIISLVGNWWWIDDHIKSILKNHQLNLKDERIGKLMEENQFDRNVWMEFGEEMAEETITITDQIGSRPLSSIKFFDKCIHNTIDLFQLLNQHFPELIGMKKTSEKISEKTTTMTINENCLEEEERKKYQNKINELTMKNRSIKMWRSLAEEQQRRASSDRDRLQVDKEQLLEKNSKLEKEVKELKEQLRRHHHHHHHQRHSLLKNDVTVKKEVVDGFDGKNDLDSILDSSSIPHRLHLNTDDVKKDLNDKDKTLGEVLEDDREMYEHFHLPVHLMSKERLIYELEKEKETSSLRLEELDTQNKNINLFIKQLEKAKKFSNVKFDEELVKSFHEQFCKTGEELCGENLEMKQHAITFASYNYKELMLKLSLSIKEVKVLRLQNSELRLALANIQRDNIGRLEKLEKDEIRNHIELRNYVQHLEGCIAANRDEYMQLLMEYRSIIAAKGLDRKHDTTNRIMSTNIRLLKTKLSLRRTDNERLRTSNIQFQKEIENLRKQLISTVDSAIYLLTNSHYNENDDSSITSIPLSSPSSSSNLKNDDLSDFSHDQISFKNNNNKLEIETNYDLDDETEKEKKSGKPSPPPSSSSSANLQSVRRQKHWKFLNEMIVKLYNQLKIDYKELETKNSKMKIDSAALSQLTSDQRSKLILLQNEKKANIESLKYKSEIEHLRNKLRIFNKKQNEEIFGNLEKAIPEVLIKQMREAIHASEIISYNKSQQCLLMDQSNREKDETIHQLEQEIFQLHEQLKLKDEAILKLAQEKSNPQEMMKLIEKEKEELIYEVSVVKEQLELQSQLTKAAEDKEKCFEEMILNLEKESIQREQQIDDNKSLLSNSLHSNTEWMTKCHRSNKRVEELEQENEARALTLENYTYKTKRILEELNYLRQMQTKYFNQIETRENEILMEKIKEYKEILNCSSCKTRQKNTVITKCFHVFCQHCVKTRVNNRSRKCPKCNVAFGLNDYSKIFLDN
ncbi:hypothetical protein SNEBB_003251 [Seison nebaliae]|nr:hypothetical protein SNEBB_003251 [Seison nebaliae]